MIYTQKFNSITYLFVLHKNKYVIAFYRLLAEMSAFSRHSTQLRLPNGLGVFGTDTYFCYRQKDTIKTVLVKNLFWS